jgi:hypothetical protein
MVPIHDLERAHIFQRIDSHDRFHVDGNVFLGQVDYQGVRHDLRKTWHEKVAVHVNVPVKFLGPENPRDATRTFESI